MRRIEFKGFYNKLNSLLLCEKCQQGNGSATGFNGLYCLLLMASLTAKHCHAFFFHSVIAEPRRGREVGITNCFLICSGTA